jgi:hypothetical protein
MKMNQYRDDSEPLSVQYSRKDTVNRTDLGSELDGSGHNRVFRVGKSSGAAVAAVTASHGPFPLRTLMVCFTVWLIATQAMIFDQVKFDERVHLLEQEARSLGGTQVIVPNERPSNLSPGANVQRL